MKDHNAVISDQVIDAFSKIDPKSESEYMGDDGFLHCAVCHKRVQTEIVHPFTNEVKKVRCICDCVKNERDAYKEQERQQDLDRMRRICFSEINMAKWTFENDDRKNKKLSDAMKKYADDFGKFKKDSKGLLLYGPVGTGKTYYASCIANALIDKGHRVLLRKLSELVNQVTGMWEGKQEFINNLNTYSLVIFDDLGTERYSGYMLEQMFNIIDARYRSGLPFIVTTNISAEEIKKPGKLEYARIYDRIIERCFPVEVAGGSRRRNSLKETHTDVKEKLGL